MTEIDSVPTRVFVLGMLDADGAVRADALYAMAPTLGMSSEQVRLCLRRLVAEGTLRRTGRGRKAVFVAPAAAAPPLMPELELLQLALDQDAGRAHWDGAWHLVTFNVPERRRPARDRLRALLRYLGGAPLAGGVYVCANPWEDYVLGGARELGVANLLTLARAVEVSVAGETSPPAIAAALWPLDDLASGYRAFTRDGEAHLRSLRAADGEPDRLIARSFQIAVEFARFAEPDPFLPPELLPASWPGTSARRLLLDVLELARAHVPDAGQPALLRTIAALAR
jgi:phenylacetic acid degradation operon negative regulatory protein